MRALPLLASVITAVFASVVLRRYAGRRGTHLLLWGVGLAMFATATLAEAVSTLGWHPLLFRLWYLCGAVLSAAWIGQGTIHLLAGPRGARTARRLTALLAAASAAAAAVLLATPLRGDRFDPARPLSAQYREILPPGAPIRTLTPLFNVYGTVALVGGALVSAAALRRGGAHPRRVAGNVLIAAGALAIAGAGTMLRLGSADHLALGELLAACLMFGGSLLATAPAASGSPARTAGAGA